MMTGGMSGGHFVGFFLAVLGLAALIFVSTRPAFVRRWGPRRWPLVGAASVLLVCVAIFASGTREIFFRTLVGPQEEVIPRITQAHVDQALEEILRPSFVAYIERLDGAVPRSNADRLARALSVRVGTTVDLMSERIEVQPPPKLGQTWLFVSYNDRENGLWAAIQGDAGVRRMMLAERIASRVLPQAAAIVALRMAKTDEEKIAIIRENPFVMPYAAEWILAELRRIAKGASPAVVAELALKQAYVEEYVKNPGLRDIHVEGRIDPP